MMFVFMSKGATGQRVDVYEILVSRFADGNAHMQDNCAQSLGAAGDGRTAARAYRREPCGQTYMRKWVVLCERKQIHV